MISNEGEYEDTCKILLEHGPSLNNGRPICIRLRGEAVTLENF